MGNIEDSETLGLLSQSRASIIYACLSRQTRDVEPCFNSGPALQTMGRHLINIMPMSRGVCGISQLHVDKL